MGGVGTGTEIGVIEFCGTGIRADEEVFVDNTITRVAPAIKAKIIMTMVNLIADACRRRITFG